MGGFLMFMIVLVVIFFSISWILPLILSWIFERKFKISLRIGRIAFPYLKLCDICVSKNGYSVHIDEIGIKSSFLNSELTKLITLMVKDVRINKDISTLVENENKIEESEENVIDFRNTKVPSFINTFAQFMAVHVYNISAMLLRSETPGCLIHSTAKELHLDGSILKNAKSLLVTLNMTDAETQVLRHSECGDKQTKLAEFSFALSMETILVAQGPLSVEKLDVKMSHTSAVISGGFYVLTKRTKTVNDDLTESKSKFSLSELKKRFFSSQLMSIYKKDDTKKTSLSNKVVKKTTVHRNSDNILHKIQPIIPKNCYIYIDNTSLKGITDNSKIEYSSSLKALSLNYKSLQTSDEKILENPNSQVVFNFHLMDLQLENSREKLLELKTVHINAKLKNYIANIYLQQNSLLLTYNHDIIHKWLYKNFLHYQQNVKDDSPEVIECSTTEKPIEKIFKKLSINFCAELTNVLAIVKLKGQDSSIGFSKIRFMLEQSQEEWRNSSYEWHLFNLLLSNRHWQVELLIESLWWSFNEWNHENVAKVMHVWRTPLYLGMGLIKFCTTKENKLKLYSIFDTLQLEWSLELSDYIILAIRCAKQYGLNKKSNKTIHKKPSNYNNLLMSLEVSHCNCFFQSQNTEYFVARLNVATLDKTQNTVEIKLEELKLFPLHNTGDCYICIRTEDISNYKMFIKSVHCDIIEKPESNSVETNLTLLENITTFWSPNTHLKSVLLYRDIMEFLNSMKEELNIQQNEPKIQSSKNKITKFNIYGKFEFHIGINEDHTAKVCLDELTFTKNTKTKETKFLNSILVMSIDDSEIFTFAGLNIHKILSLKDLENVRNERIEAGFELELNESTWNIKIDLFKAVFPYEHNYAEAVQNQLVSVYKWLKILHSDMREPVKEGNMSLPADLVFNIKEFLFEMSDDPFEVKLRDNFELLEDEYNESIKRQKTLKEKIEELCKTHLHLPAGKVEELYATLRKKNAEIYIQRSKLMYNAQPQRTRLFAWMMNNIELMALADSSTEGLEAAANCLQTMDPHSTWNGAPEKFSTLWIRAVALRVKDWRVQLRDFPQPLVRVCQMALCGQLAGAEHKAPARATRTVQLHLGEPFGTVAVERGMIPLKFYHDLNCEIEEFSYAFGPCWEPAIAMCNLAFSKISAPSRDPSPPLPWWDKARLLFHGRLTLAAQRAQLLLHASLDPYNTTEEMALTWVGLVMDWTNAKFVYKGDLNVYVRTASKYDDVQLLKLPNLKLVLGIQWVCLGDPNDHHSVVPCAPDKVPEYSSNQVHDSYRAFRSQNVNLSISLETKPTGNQHPSCCPILLLYGSTLRWIESLKLILSGVTRPTKRGPIFNNICPRKIQLSRHYKKINLIIGLHKFQVCYWMSFAMQKGCELSGGRLSSCSEHSLALVGIEDGLKHRPKAEWSIVYMNSELSDSEIWLKSAIQDESEIEAPSVDKPVEKCFLLSVAKVSYGRETVVANQERNKDTPTHRLVVYDLRGTWTRSNRNVAFSLFDAFMRNMRMKKNLSTEALKVFRNEGNVTPLKRRSGDSASSAQSTPVQGAVQTSENEVPTSANSPAASMLEKLLAEADDKPVAYSDDLSAAAAPRQPGLQAFRACHADDVLHTNWQISLVNAQVVLRGSETKGYIIISAAKAGITQKIHRPAWRARALVSKTTWAGQLECMQYYATVGAAHDGDRANENIMWLPIDQIEEREDILPSEDAECMVKLVGSGVAVGAVVGDTVGGAEGLSDIPPPPQLQRIVSRCRCEFFYADYGDVSSAEEAARAAEVPPVVPVLEGDGPCGGESLDAAADAFTLTHHDLEVCTNSQQYATALDVVNNLVLAGGEHRQKALARRARLRFQLQLEGGGAPTLAAAARLRDKQQQLRQEMRRLRRLEKDAYLLRKAAEESPNDEKLSNDARRLDNMMHECKIQIVELAEELDALVSVHKEAAVAEKARLRARAPDQPAAAARAHEICFRHARWRLTEVDGQIGVADLVLANFQYTKISKSDNSVEHLLELGYLRMTNLLPNEIYKEVIYPTEIQYYMPVEHKKVLRIFCRERPPVGGISVKEHFEINLVPLTIGMTKKFYQTMMKFAFPERDSDPNDDNDDVETESTKGSKQSKSRVVRKGKNSNFYVGWDKDDKPKDDVDKMKERAEKNKLFVYIKIPEVPLKVSYKGGVGGRASIENVRDLSLVAPTLEYHNVTWTWLDLALAVRNDARRLILAQAIRQKLRVGRGNSSSGNSSTAPPTDGDDDEKARLLLGRAPENKSKRKSSSTFRLAK